MTSICFQFFKSKSFANCLILSILKFKTYLSTPQLITFNHLTMRTKRKRFSKASYRRTFYKNKKQAEETKTNQGLGPKRLSFLTQKKKKKGEHTTCWAPDRILWAGRCQEHTASRRPLSRHTEGRQAPPEGEPGGRGLAPAGVRGGAGRTADLWAPGASSTSRENLDVLMQHDRGQSRPLVTEENAQETDLKTRSLPSVLSKTKHSAAHPRAKNRLHPCEEGRGAPRMGERTFQGSSGSLSSLSRSKCYSADNRT